MTVIEELLPQRRSDWSASQKRDTPTPRSDTPERIRLRVDRLARAAESARVARVESAVADAHLVQQIGLERVLGKADFLGMDFIELALAVARFVGRVRIRSASGATLGYGTGFMVSPRLLITNNHVLPSSAVAAASVVEFDYQLDRTGTPLPVKSFAFDTQAFFRTDKALDFTLVGVAESARDGTRLSNYGWSRLIAEQGKAIIGEALNIIQHPSGEPKQIVLRSNELTEFTNDFARYTTDTQPGASGSPVYNDQWEVVALHHSGVPRMKNGVILDKQGRPWPAGGDEKNIAWIANEGVRVSSIVKAIKGLSLSAPERKLRDALLDALPPSPIEVAARREGTSSTIIAAGANAPLVVGSTATWTLPLRITVSLDNASAVVVAANGQAATAEPVTAALGAASAMLTEAISIDPNYATRKGYDAKFLGSGAAEVPLPKLSSKLREQAALNALAPAGADKVVLPYHHFSLVMHKPRRLAIFTAVNIDGSKWLPIKREDDRWFFDPRLDRALQIGNDTYASNPLDRGHLVRRLDPAWGVATVAKVANDDTFHFTNCSPQHEKFNQGSTLWAGLEDYILDNADNENLKVCVFTGPVLRSTDPPFVGVQLPLEYWKVVVMKRKSTKKLSATAYLVSQRALIDDMLEDFQFGAYRTFQTTIKNIEKLSKLSFGALSKFDPKSNGSGAAHEALGGAVELNALEDIEL